MGRHGENLWFFFISSLNSTIKHLFPLPPAFPLPRPTALLSFCPSCFHFVLPCKKIFGFKNLEDGQHWKIKSSFCLQICHCVQGHRVSSLPVPSASVSEDVPAVGMRGNSHSVPVSACSLGLPIIQHCVKLDLGYVYKDHN